MKECPLPRQCGVQCGERAPGPEVTASFPIDPYYAVCCDWSVADAVPLPHIDLHAEGNRHLYLPLYAGAPHAPQVHYLRFEPS
jgi:hypothetical protein